MVLAAGRSVRFGSPKQLALLEGRPLAAHAFGAVAAACRAGILDGGVAVVAAGDEAVERLARAAGLDVAWNEHAHDGLSTSLRTGLHHLTSPGLDPAPLAALVCLADQPRLRAEVMVALLDAWDEGRADLIRPRYAGDPRAPGHPVLLDRRLWPEADAATGDAAFARFAATRTHFVRVEGQNPDVDVPGDLGRA
ncbi:MAG: NTP transferase domain-containing protein [Gemmatimonadales bacterium]|nr:NTP transferase domain-containing protein [Gemmatimonadales bacterium]